MLTPDQRDAVVQAARLAARAHVLPRFRSLAPGDIDTKSGPADLVTIADTQAEAMIADTLSRTWPDAVVIGEEGVSRHPALRDSFASDATLVIVDPVDGTWNFAKGLSVFGMIIAVVRDGQTEFGMLYDPLLDDWVEADSTGARFVTSTGAVPCGLNRSGALDHLLGYMPLHLFDRATRVRLLPRFAHVGRMQNLRCSCHEYRMLAMGHGDFILSGPEPHPWDHAAGALAVQAAGGVSRFLDETDYTVARGQGVLLTATSQASWDAVAAEFSDLAAF